MLYRRRRRYWRTTRTTVLQTHAHVFHTFTFICMYGRKKNKKKKIVYSARNPTDSRDFPTGFCAGIETHCCRWFFFFRFLSFFSFLLLRQNFFFFFFCLRSFYLFIYTRRGFSISDRDTPRSSSVRRRSDRVRPVCVSVSRRV